MRDGRRAALAFTIMGITALNPGLGKGQSFVSSPAPFGTVNVGLPQMAAVRQEALIHGGNYVRLSQYSETHQGRRLSRAVGRLEVLRADGRTGYCTASIISRDYILTNNHCLPGQDEPSRPLRASLLMNYYDEAKSNETVRYDVDIRPVETSRWPDYSILQVSGNPSAHFGSLNMLISDPQPDEPLMIFHHPRAQPMMMSHKNCKTAAIPIDNNGQMIHYCDTEEGSSGAPILNAGGTRLIGLHSSGSSEFNMAIPLINVIKKSVLLSRLFPDLWSESVHRPEMMVPEQKDSVFRDCGDCPVMVKIPAGSFTMGSPRSEPRWQVLSHGRQTIRTIEHSFAVGRYEVTFEEWDTCVAAGGCGGYRPDDSKKGRGRRPVVRVSWYDAKSYAAWLTQRTGKPYRLLSEEEWEYAARAGTTTPFSTGPTITTEQANFVGTPSRNNDFDWILHPGKAGSFYLGAPGTNLYKAVEVGSYPPNKFSLYDMHGNASEWVEDCFEFEVPRHPNAKCDARVVRGGSYNSNARSIGSAQRTQTAPDYRLGSGHGFRVARDLK